MDDTTAALILFCLFVLLMVVVKPKKSKQKTPQQSLHYRKVVPLRIDKTAEHPPIVGGCWVIDGDTIHIGSHKIRLQGINAPELDEPYGKQAKWALHKMVKGQTITAYPNGEKSYGRMVAKCFLDDGRDLAAEMVKMGLALDLPNYPDADYKHLETPASRKKLSWKPRKKKDAET